MTLKKVCGFALLLCIFLSTRLTAQSSIYQDAKTLATLAEKNALPILRFEKINTGYNRHHEYNYVFKRGYNKVTVFSTLLLNESVPSYQLPSFGNYSFNLSDQDTLQIVLADTTLLVSGMYQELNDSIFLTTVAEIDFDSDGIRLYSENVALYYDSKSNSEKSCDIVLEVEHRKKLLIEWGYDFQKIMDYINTHSSFLVESSLDLPSYEKANVLYRSNPFFGALMEKKQFALPSTDRYFVSKLTMGNYYGSNSVFSNLIKNYEWHQLLYGDSTLELQKQVSYKEVIGNYRTPVVTARSELIDATAQINESTQNRNLLDAQTVAVGLSDFIAERAQEELNLTFFTRFKENLSNPSELTVLFPETKKLLYQFEISNYKTLLSNAREAFTVDLDNLGLHFPDVLELPQYRAALYNSPEVYNVSLIYSIANLAYKETPVEDILLYSFQKLQNRDLNLSKDINLTLAENILQAKPSVVSSSNKKKLIPKRVRPGSEIPLLENHMKSYTSNLKRINSDISSAFEDLRSILDALRSIYPTSAPALTYNSIDAPASGVVEIPSAPVDLNANTLGDLLFDIDEERSRMWYDFARGIFGKSGQLPYNDRVVYSGENSIQLYEDFLDANLHGKEYYNDLLKHPDLEDYERYFKDGPIAKTQSLARGISICRRLLDLDSESFLLEKLDALSVLTDEIEAVHKNLEYVNLKEKATEIQLSTFVKRAKLIRGAIEEETFFWERTLQQNKSDHQIAALYHLKGILENNETINNLILLHNNFQAAKEKEEPFDLNENVKTLFNGGSIQMILKDAEDQLNVIKEHLKDKYKQLVLLNADLPFDEALDEKKKNYLSHFETKQEFRLRERTIESNFQQDREELPQKIFTKKENDVAYQNLREEINRLEQIIEELVKDETKIDSFNTTLEALTKLRNERLDIDATFVKEQIRLREELGKTKNEQLAAIKLEESKRDSSFFIHSDTFPPSNELIGDHYHFINDNSCYVAYILAGREADGGGVSEFISYPYIQLQNSLSNIRRQVDSAQINKTLAIQHLTNLEADHCQSLVDAKVNAKNLAKSLEVAIHLMFAFRDYEGVDSTLFYNDTTQLKITTNQVDSTTGVVMALAVIDTFRVNAKPIIEIEKDKKRSQWIGRDKFKKMQNNEVEWNFFLGLLYERLNAIEDVPQFSSEGVALLATKFLEITNNMATHRTNLRIKKANSPERVSFKDYYPFIRSTVDMFNTVLQTQSIGDSSLIKAMPALENIPKISDDALSLYENIYVKEYSGAILNAMGLLNTITSGRLNDKEKRQSSRAINAVFTYGTFMANMIDAQSSDQVKTILKSATLPPGSSRIKRETTSSLTINSYLGAAVGRDVLIDAPNGVERSSYGGSLSVPIGFTYSISPNWIKNNSSVSLFVPLIDLGAVTAYRQNPKSDDYSIEALPELKWRNLFSPGLFAVYNFANNPFSLGVGGQYGPQLREIKLETGDPVSVNSFRFPMVFFNIDVPFFNLHTGAKKIVVR